MTQNDKDLPGITRRESLKKIGKYGFYVPATMAVLSAAPRAFAQSGVPRRISGTVAFEASGQVRMVVTLLQITPVDQTACLSSGSTYDFPLQLVDLNSTWSIAVSLSETTGCDSYHPQFHMTASGPDAGVGIVRSSESIWDVAGGAWAAGATTGVVNFHVTDL